MRDGKWIWAKDAEGKNCYAEFCGSFIYNGGGAGCRISADGDYTLFINGEYAASGQYGDFEHYKIYDDIDISPRLKNGKNVLCVLVWHFGEDLQRYKKYAPGVLFEVYSGDDILLCSGKDTMSRKSRAYKSGLCKKITPQLGFSFLYDKTAEDEWLKGKGDGFSESVLADKKCQMYKRPIKKAVHGTVVHGKKLSGDEKNAVFDIGGENVGLLSFALESSAVQKITVCFGENLENGHVRRFIGGRDFSVEYIASEGFNEYTNYMLRLGCRYLEFCGEDKFDISFAGIIPERYPTEEKKCLPRSDTDKMIYEMCLKTLRLCMMEHYVDCPWREQCLYAFDSRNQMLCGYYAFEDGNFEYARANLLLFAKDKREDLLLSICSPCGRDKTIPSFSLYYIIAVWEYTEHSGDISLAREAFGKIRDILSAFADNMENGLVNKFRGESHWNFYDWSIYADYADEGKTDILINALFLMALQSFAKICKVLKETDEFEKYADVVRKKAHDEFYSEDTGLFSMHSGARQFTELVQSMAVLSGIAETGECEKIINALKKEELASCSLSMKTFVYEAMLKIDKENKHAVLEFIRRDYKKMALNCADTVWETLDGAAAFENAGSLCHGWSAMPIYYYHKFGMI